MKKIKFLLLTLVALVGGLTASATKTVYVDPVGNGTWMAGSAKISLNVFTDGQSNNAWASFTTLSDGVIKFTFDDSYDRMIIVRGENQDAWGWNQTENITFETNKLYKANGYNGSTMLYTVEDYTEPVAAGYTVDFNTAITTSNHDFKVAKGWDHIVASNNYDNYGPYYMTYSYKSEDGVGGTGALYAARQYAGDYGGGEVCYDLLVTPAVNGTVTLDVKASGSSSSNNAFVEVYAINTDGTRGSLLKTIKEDIAGYNTGSNTEWATFTLAELSTEQKLGLRLQYVIVDNFAASSVNIPAERKLEVTKVANLDGNSGTSGSTTYYEQQADGTLKVQLQVTLTNTGDYDLAVGDADYTLTLASASSSGGSKTYYDDATYVVALSEPIAVGETKAVNVDFFVPYTSGWKYWFVKENVSGTTSSTYRYSGVIAYEPKFIFREAGSTSSSSISTAEAWGTITVNTTKNYEIANTGTAPLTIKSVTLPDGFTSDNAPTAEFTIAKGETQALNITQDATTMGTFAGELKIVYLDKNNAEQTYKLAFSATVIGANTWTADFNNSTSTVIYPEGSVAEGGINRDYQYISSGNYNNWLVGRTGSNYNVENNKFITPKLHANAGDQLSFDVKAGYSSTNDYFVKVYVSTDRKTWGDPLAYYTYTTDATKGSEGVGSAFTTKTVTFSTAGDYYVAFALYGTTSSIDNLVGLEKVAVTHDLYIKSVSWPDASIKSGASQTKPSVDVIPLTNEDAANYTVKYIYGENEVLIPSKALTASASSTTSFAASFAPSVSATTTFPGTKVVFEFIDGTKFETETFDLTVTNEPIFHFLGSKYTSRWYEPSSDYTTPVNFGKVNVSGDSKTFYVMNWGSAPLTVKSITVPEGFTVSASSMTIPAFDGTQAGLETCQLPLDITFSATVAGTYSGNMVITYVDGNGTDATFELALNGTMLDSNNWYANFGSASNQWPAGSVYQDNVSTTYVATDDYAITSSSTTNNLFITPKLTAAVGDKLLFDAKLYNSSWPEGKVVVYAAATRDELINFDPAADTRTAVFTASGTDATNTITTDYKTFEVPAVAGDNYYAFEISGRPYVDELYGLKLAEVAHDLQIASSNIPAEGMQNYASTATVNVLNFGIVNDKVTVTAYVNNVAVATSAETEVAMNHKLTDAGTQVSVSYMSNEAGTFPVYLEVKAGDVTMTTAAVDVDFLAEVATADGIQVGTQTSTGRDFGFVDWYNNDGSTTRYTDILYTAAKISAAGIKAGDQITAITFKGSNSAKSFKAEVTSWVGTSTGDITYGSPDKSSMEQVTVYTGTVDFPANVESVINLSNPIVWDGTSDIRVYTEAIGQGNGNWMSVQYPYDANLTMSYNGATKAGTVAYFTLAASAATLAGKVLDSEGNGIYGATITLKADNGVQYSGNSIAAGEYSFDVIQSNLNFTATVEAPGYLKRQFALNMGGASATQDVTMYKQFGIVGSLPGLDWDNDLVMTQDAENPNIFVAELNNIGANAGEYKYKLRADGEWKGNLADGYELPDPGDFEWEIKTTGVYNYKFTFDWTNHTLTFERPYTLAENATGVDELNWVDVTIEREFKAGWNAVVLPFNLDNDEFVAAFGANSEVAISDGDHDYGSGNVTVFFKKQDDTYKWIEAGTPYLIWLENPVSGLKFTKDIVTNTSYTSGQNFDFVGVYTTTQTQDGDYFVKNGEFQKCNTTNTVKPFRAYLKFKGATPVRSLNFVVDDETVTTEIDGLEIDTPVKVEGAYNLSGQKVENLKKGGLYIINGKKVIWK